MIDDNLVELPPSTEDDDHPYYEPDLTEGPPPYVRLPPKRVPAPAYVDPEIHEQKIERQIRFLDRFRRIGVIGPARKALGVHTQTLVKWRREPAFAAAFDELEQEIVDDYELEMRHRVLHGVPHPVVSAGKLVTTEYVKSDNLIMFVLRARRPGIYTESRKTAITGPDGGPLTIGAQIELTSKFVADVLSILGDESQNGEIIEGQSEEINSRAIEEGDE
jgi:hypothetical protein